MRVLLLVVGVLAAACHDAPVDPLATDDGVATWANRASALGVYVAYAYEPEAVADGQSSFDSPDCPLVTDDGETVVITGGCSANGTYFLGTATIERRGDDREITLDGYGSTGDLALQTRRSGRITITAVDADTHEFEMDVSESGIRTATITYSGTVVGGYEGATVWSGDGVFDWDGDHVEASTADEVVDGSVCDGQSVSGSTILTSEDHDVVVRYDGASECDDLVPFTRDGVPGRAKGVACAAIPASGDTAGLVLLVLVALYYRLGRRRAAAGGRPSRAGTGRGGTRPA